MCLDQHGEKLEDKTATPHGGSRTVNEGLNQVLTLEATKVVVRPLARLQKVIVMMPGRGQSISVKCSGHWQSMRWQHGSTSQLRGKCLPTMDIE
jgi:hypothetical protein